MILCVALALPSLALGATISFLKDEVSINTSIEFHLPNSGSTTFSQQSSGTTLNVSSTDQHISYQQVGNGSDIFEAYNEAGFSSRNLDPTSGSITIDASVDTERFGDGGAFGLGFVDPVDSVDVTASLYLEWIFDVIDGPLTLTVASVLPEFNASPSFFRLTNISNNAVLADLQGLAFLSGPLTLLPSSRYRITALASERNGDDDEETDFYFSFNGVNEVKYSVPDTGSTLSLLGLSLVALALAKRKKSGHVAPGLRTCDPNKRL